MKFQQFIQNYNELKKKHPLSPTHSIKTTNSDYSDYCFNVDNAYYSFDNAQCQNIMYICDSFKATDCCDGDYVVESQNCYDCVDLARSNNCAWCTFCNTIYNCYFCHDCNNCHDLFGCVYLDHKQFCIFNKQYSEEEYKKKLADLLQKPYEENIARVRTLLMKHPVTITRTNKSENSDYTNQVFFSKNMYLCFDSAHDENCAYIYDSHHNKYCYDFFQSHHSEWCYESVDSANMNNCYFMKDCEDMSDSGFCEFCVQSNHLFGCYGLKRQDHCILNKKYTPEDYEREVKEIMSSFEI